MGDRWFITRDGKQRYGPFPDEQLRQLAASGKLLPSDMVWLEGSPQWITASSIGGLFSKQPLVPELPEFRYVHLPFFRPDLRRIVFAVDRAGTLTGVSKSVKTYVSGGGGGGSVYSDSYGRTHGSFAPTWIETRHETTMDLWVLEASGRESSIQINKDIPLKEGHQVTVVNACLDGHDAYLCLILNHTAGEMHLLKRSHAAVRLSLVEWLTILTVIVGLLLVCVLLGAIGGALGFFTFIIAVAILTVLVLMRRAFLRQRFARHCEHVASLLL